MLRIHQFLLFLLSLSSQILAIDPSFKFEGVLGAPVENIRNMNTYVAAFVPYNPVIVEIGPYEGEGTKSLALTYPYGKIWAIEAHPAAYAQLVDNLQAHSNVIPVNLAIHTRNGTAFLSDNGAQSSLLPVRNNQSKIQVPCMKLDDWCQKNNIDHIDFLRLDAAGVEWGILRQSPLILKTVLVLVVTTQTGVSSRAGIAFPALKQFLEDQGFELLAHWYQEGKEGEATFVRKYLYDALFR